MDEGVNCGSEKETNIETATKKDEDTASYFPYHFCNHHSIFCNIARAVLSEKMPAQEIMLVFSNEKGNGTSPRRESNPDLELRRFLHYPLCYEGEA